MLRPPPIAPAALASLLLAGCSGGAAFTTTGAEAGAPAADGAPTRDAPRGRPDARPGDAAGYLYRGCFDKLDRGGAPFTPPSKALFSGPTTIVKGWKFAWDGYPRGAHRKNRFAYDTAAGAQRIVADGSSMVLYRSVSPYRFPRKGTLQIKYRGRFDTTYSGTPASQGCKGSDAGWVEILMTNDVRSVIRAIVWKNDGSRDGRYDLKKVCPLTDPDVPTSPPCYLGIKVGAHQDGKDSEPKYPCARGDFIYDVSIDALCLR